MHFVCDRIALNEALQVLQNVVSSNTTLPILCNIFIDSTGKDTLTLIATNLEVGIQMTVKAQVLETGTCTLPGKKLYEIAKEMIGPTIDVEISSDHVGVIRSANAVYKVMGQAAEEYPRLPRLDKVHTVKMGEDVLKELLKKTSYAISNDETRYVLNGVYFVLSKGEIIVVATDGRRLSMIKRKVEVDQNLEVGIIIPSKTVNELMRVFHGSEEIDILFSENQVGFKKEDMVIISRLIEGKFPNYDQVIPKKTKDRVTLNRLEFLNMIRRVALITDVKSTMIKFIFHDNLLTLTASNPEVGEAKDDMPVTYDGENFSIAFNPVYLIDALKVLEDEEIAFEFTDSSLPGVIKGKDDFVYVIMPMKLR